MGIQKFEVGTVVQIVNDPPPYVQHWPKGLRGVVRQGVREHTDSSRVRTVGVEWEQGIGHVYVREVDIRVAEVDEDHCECRAPWWTFWNPHSRFGWMFFAFVGACVPGVIESLSAWVRSI